MGNLFGSDFMDFMVYKDIKEKKEKNSFKSEDAYFDAFNSPIKENNFNFSTNYFDIDN